MPSSRALGTVDTAPFARALEHACRRRAALAGRADLTAWRVLDGKGDGVPGVTIDRYGPAAVLNVYDDAGLPHEAVTRVAEVTLEQLGPSGIEAVYVKAFVRDRSRLGGDLPGEATSPTPRAGSVLPESLVVEEYGVRYEVRPYDGLSTGLFLDHRDHRRALAERRPRAGAEPVRLHVRVCDAAGRRRRGRHERGRVGTVSRLGPQEPGA